MWLYKFGKRKGFGILACSLILLALLVAFSNIFSWLNVPSTLALPFGLFKGLLALVVVICWVILNIPPPKLPTGKFLIALAEFGQEIERDGGYYGELRSERRNRMALPGRGEGEFEFEDETAQAVERNKKGSRYLNNLLQTRKSNPTAVLQGGKQARSLPSVTSSGNTTLILRPDDTSSRTNGDLGGVLSGGRRTRLLSNREDAPLIATNEIGEPTEGGRQPKRKFVKPEYLDNWTLVSGPKEITAFLQDELKRQITEIDTPDLTIYPTDFADDPTAAIQVASQTRPNVVIWGWNVYHTRRDFVPNFEVLKSLEDAPPPAGDMQIMGLDSFDLGLQTSRRSYVFRAFVTGLGAYGLRKYEQARNEFSLALVASYINEINPRYNSRVDQAIIYFFLGNTYYYSSQFDKAFRCYQEAWAIDSELYEARHNIGVVLALQGKPDFAIKSLVGVIREKPNLAVARYNLGMAYLDKQDYSKCRRELSNAIKIDLRYASAYRGLGLSYFKEQLATEGSTPALPAEGESVGRRLYEQAIEYLGEALRIRPDYARARVDLGRIRLHQATRVNAIVLRLGQQYEKASASPTQTLTTELRSVVADLQVMKQTAPELRETINQSVIELQEAVTSLLAGDFSLQVIREEINQAEESLRGANNRLLGQATAELQEAIKLDPNLAEAHYMLGVCFRQQENLEDAVASFKEVIRLRAEYRDINYALSRYALGEIYRQRGQDDLAEKEFEEATRARAAVSPVSAQDYINQGVGFLGNQQFGEAREAFEKALDLEPDNPEAMLNLGAVYQESGNYNSAFSIYQNVLKLTTPPEAIYYRLSSLYQQMGDDQSAFDTIKKAADKNTRSAKLQYWLGNAYRRRKDEAQAMASYINAFRIDPDNADARFNLAMIYLGRKQQQDAILQFNEVVRIRPDDFQTHSFLGRTYWQMGMTDEAISALKEAIRIKPNATDALLTLGQIYQRQAEAELAIEQFETALTYTPNDLRTRELLASAYALDGKVDLSIEQFQAILSSEPNHPSAHYNLGVSYTSKERFDLATREFLEYVRLKPDDADGYFNLGLAFKEQTLIMESIQALSKAIELRPTYAGALQVRGQLYIAINDNEKGIADLQAFQRLKN